MDKRGRGEKDEGESRGESVDEAAIATIQRDSFERKDEESKEIGFDE